MKKCLLVASLLIILVSLIGCSASNNNYNPTPNLPALPQYNGEPQVKKSTSNICHERGSTYYDRTKNFIPYNSIQECLNSGGRLPLK